MEGSRLHVVAGGVAGTLGALFTSPLEIVKTRLQSSVNTWAQTTSSRAVLSPATTCDSGYQISKRLSIYRCIMHIYTMEGAAGLFKGLSMTVAGVLPARAIYFGAYFNGQELFAPLYPKGSHANVFAASSFAGFVSNTVTNPIWYVKTRMQLDQSPLNRAPSVWQCVISTWRHGGFLTFFKGLQASYIGIAETALQFVLYEHMKRKLTAWANGRSETAPLQADDVMWCTVASGSSKAISTLVCYPHEVLRTRLRQEGNKYQGLARTLRLIVQEEGANALYRGMFTHFVRQIPNTCIVLTTYEAIVHLFQAKASVL